jgi:hypothetical protein
MATSHYFRHNVKSEQNLYEDIIIESMKFYGHDMYYLPREVITRDFIWDDAVLSQFHYAFKIEMYIESVEGFDGDGDLFTKFGVEIRDAVTLVMARRRWNTEIRKFNEGPEDINDREANVYYRPREGDLIHIPMADATFEIQKVEDENPFYQLGNLPTFKMRCEKFEYSDERFETGVPEIDRLARIGAYQTVLTLDTVANGFEIGEVVYQQNNTYRMEGTVADWKDSDKELYLAHVGATDKDEYREFLVGNPIQGTGLLNSRAMVIGVDGVQEIQPGSPGGSSEDIPSFDVSAFEFVDFSEKNPFGDPI